MRILVTPTSFNQPEAAEARRLLESFADDIVYNAYGRPLKEAEAVRMAEGCDGYLAGLDDISGRAISLLPGSLKVISRYGAGVDRVDLEAATQKRIVVTNTPGANSEAVADLAFGLLLAAARRIPVLDRKLRAGEWTRFQGTEAFGKTLGILGLGAIGKAVARRAQGFAMRLLAYDPYLDPAYARDNGIIPCTFEELLRDSDFISLHLPLTDSTRHIISKRAIGLMKRGAVIVNTARGGLIDEEAAYAALREGKLGGLALDAFEKEPPGQSPLFSLENVVVTPHTGAHTAEAVKKMAVTAVNNLIAVLEGKECPYIVNREVLKI